MNGKINKPTGVWSTGLIRYPARRHLLQLCLLVFPRHSEPAFLVWCPGYDFRWLTVSEDWPKRCLLAKQVCSSNGGMRFAQTCMSS
jgi:hypothetical protein